MIGKGHVRSGAGHLTEETGTLGAGSRGSVLSHGRRGGARGSRVGGGRPGLLLLGRSGRRTRRDGRPGRSRTSS
jgi:hypothetical protein